MAEYTCVWFHEELAKFVKSDDTNTLLINGGPATGKTTLAAALAERLQRPIARKSYTTLFFSAGGAPSQTDSLAVVQALLCQLLGTRIGDMHLYNAVTRAYEQARHTADQTQYENLLWHALEEALRTPFEYSNDTVLIVDGLDELANGQAGGTSLLQRLTAAVGKSKGNKLIALARNLKPQANSSTVERTITPTDTSGDIRELALKKLASSHHFRTKTGREQDTIINRIIGVGDGSFTWVLLTCEVLCLEKSPDDFSKAVSNFQSPKLSVDDLVHILVTRSQATDDARLLLSWLVCAARPLTYHEIECISAVNTSNRAQPGRSVDVHQIVTSLGSLLNARENIVSIRHSAARVAIFNLLKSSKITVPVKDHGTDFFLRLLAYAKASLPDKGEPTLDDADHGVVDATFSKLPLMEYVVRYWVLHLGQTSAFKPGKAPDVKSIPEMDKVFPSSTIMAILEWLCWDDQYPGAKEVELHESAGQVRKQVFTERHPAVLQSYINAACYYETMSDWTHASSLWYIISTVGRDVLSVSHPVVVESATRFLTATETHITSSRSELVTQRESILILLISAYERQFGMHSDIVMQTRQRLVELYRHINEQERASEVLKVIQDGSSTTETKETTASRGVNGNLRVSLSHKRQDSAINGYEEGIFIDDDEEEESTTLTHVGEVDAILREIEKHVSKKEHAQAEQLYVDLLQRVSLACRSTSNVEWHAKKIDVFQSYASYLEKQERRIEAVSLTTSLWQDYQHSEMSYSEALVSKLSQSALFLKSVGEYTAALAIFKHASSFYRSVKKDESRSLTEIEEQMVATSTQALKETSRDVSSNTASTSESSQSDMFHLLVSNKSKSVDQSTMTLAKSLVSRYVEQGAWSQAISVIHSTLSRTWSSFLTTSVHEVTLASAFQSDSIELIQQLAFIYKEQRLFEKAEDVYIRLFRAALSSPKDEAFLTTGKDLLIEFYTQRGYPNKSITVYQELLAVYRRIFGPDHEKTITTMYELGSRCRNQARSHPYWIEYYQQIVNVLNKSSTTVSARAMDAAVIVAQSYWEERRSSDAVALYSMIWTTFTSNHKDFKIFKDEQFVRSLYERYYQSLEETTADFATLRKVTLEYRETAKAVFGAQSALAVESTLALARVSQQSESHIEESISLYEEAMSNSARSASSSSSSFMSQSVLQQTLATMYKKRVLHSSSSSASSESLAKETSMFESQLKEMKSKYSYSNEETLNSVCELSQLYVRQGKTEQASKELSTVVVGIVQHEMSSQKMFEAAQSLVQTYQSCNLTKRCVSLIEELHYQLITKEKKSSSTFSVVESSSAAISFLAAMEYQLRKDLSITLTEITASLTAEAIMYRNFKHMVTSNASLDKVIIAAAPVRHLCQSWKRQPIVEAVEHECVQLFIRRDGSSVQLLSKESPRIFIIGILDHLGGRKCQDFVRSVILASNKTVKSLVDHNKFTEAHDVVKVAFMYAQYHNGYRGTKGISRGFELASYLDGRGENKCSDPQLRKKLLQLSNDIIKDVLKICRDQNINIAQVSLTELNELIALLGEQQDYSTLEVCLDSYIESGQLLTDYSSDAARPTVEHTRSPEELASGDPADYQPPSHLRPLPCWPPYQGCASLRRYCLQLSAGARRHPPRHDRVLRAARPALHQHRPVVPARGELRQSQRRACFGVLQEGHPRA